MIYPSSFIEYCKLIRHKMTSLRKTVLYILWHTKKPLKAYEVLDYLLQIKGNSKPSTVYRVLDYFIACGIVHKIESIQSYMLCHTPIKQASVELLLVCSQCHQVNEVHDKEILSVVESLAKVNDFLISKEAIELKGICKRCWDKEKA
ncbi:Fur family transcriptional regulator [Legionella sp. CNM-1927-20]|uniref:Fur family transcriptional regulator n=1 Tax=Legionella sp. CNM-1927-20 TaxID=3422221 RepID=UPI00403AA86D